MVRDRVARWAPPLLALMAACLSGGCDAAGESPAALTGQPAPTRQPALTAAASPSAVANPFSFALCEGAAAGNGLTAEGATFSSWNAHHEAYPDGGAGNYGPVQNDGLGRYTNVRCTAGGDVIAYDINEIPGVDL